MKLLNKAPDVIMGMENTEGAVWLEQAPVLLFVLPKGSIQAAWARGEAAKTAGASGPST